MRKKIFLVLGVVLLLAILIFNFISAEMLVSDAGVEYDSAIVSAFNSSDWIFVLIRLEDNSGTLPSQVNERNEWFVSVIGDILSSFSFEEFQFPWKGGVELELKHSDGFEGFISEQGFEKLINDNRIKSISLITQGAHAMKNETNNGTNDEFEEKINKIKWRGLIWVGSIVGVILIILYLIKIKK